MEALKIEGFKTREKEATDEPENQKKKIDISTGNAHNIRLGDMSGIAVVTVRSYWCDPNMSGCISISVEYAKLHHVLVAS